MWRDIKVIVEGYKRLSEGLKTALKHIICICMPIYVRMYVRFPIMFYVHGVKYMKTSKNSVFSVN
jgi:hypothetical protein